MISGNTPGFMPDAAFLLGIWLGGVAIDLVFGDRAWFQPLSAINAMLLKPYSFFSKKLNRPGRSARALGFRAFMLAVLLIPAFCFSGLLLDEAIMQYPVTAAAAAVITASMLRLKVMWLEAAKAGTDNPATIRQTIRQICQRSSAQYIAVLVAFAVGGFAALLPVWFLFLVNQLGQTRSPTSFDHFFHHLGNIVAVIGAVPGVVFVFCAQLLWPAAKWRLATKALARPTRPLAFWPCNVLAYGLDVAIEGALHAGKQRWLGPKGATAQLKADHLRSALIVTVIAFSLINGFLLLIVLASLMG